MYRVENTHAQAKGQGKMTTGAALIEVKTAGGCEGHEIYYR
jgi:hypothetical protein